MQLLKENLTFVLTVVAIFAGLAILARVAEKTLCRSSTRPRNAKYIAVCAMCAALAGLLMLLEIPVFFAPGFYKIDLSELEDLNDPSTETPQDDTLSGIPRKFLGLVIALLIIAVIAAAVFLLWRRIDKKRKALREGIDSHDPRTAVTALFPYTVRWLKAGGIDTDAHPFSELTPYIAGEYSQDYANRYRKMYILWREAAYSDHRIDEQTKNSMAGEAARDAQILPLTGKRTIQRTKTHSRK